MKTIYQNLGESFEALFRFRKPLAEIEGKAEELRALARQNDEMDVEAEAEALDKKAEIMLKDLYRNLTPWRKCQVARHPERPHCIEYVNELFSNSLRYPVIEILQTTTQLLEDSSIQRYTCNGHWK